MDFQYYKSFIQLHDPDFFIEDDLSEFEATITNKNIFQIQQFSKSDRLQLNENTLYQ